MSRTRFAFVAALAAAAGAAAAFACGSNYRPFSIGGVSVLTAPRADFQLAVRRLTPSAASLPKTNVSGEAESADLREALVACGSDPSVIDDVVQRVAAVRVALRVHANELTLWHGRGRDPESRPCLAAQPLPGELPIEFALYLQGAVAWADDQPDAARDAWSRVLALPEGERRFRSTWAAYMLGRSLVDVDPARAADRFELCRTLAASGLRDTDHLAAESLGWEARAWFVARDFGKAIDLYLRQGAEGVDVSDSLRIVALDVADEDGEALRALAARPGPRRVMTAYAVSVGTYGRSAWEMGQYGRDTSFARGWLDAVEAAGAPAEDADRLAWVAYATDDFDLAARWVTKAPADSPVAAWIGSKLCLREGRLDEAAALLAAAERGFGDGDDPAFRVCDDTEFATASRRAKAERGIVELCRSRYAESLDLLVAAKAFEDAAYVAERVLTPAELRDYVDRRHPVEAEGTDGKEAGWTPGRLRLVLARRLARLGGFADAREYFPEATRPLVDRYAAALRGARDVARSGAERAASFREAAVLVIEHGDELVATETEPDWGGFEFDHVSDRARRTVGDAADGPTADERRRYAIGGPPAGCPVGFRATAVDLAWSAAELMPDETEETAAWLCRAATWVTNPDAAAGDRFLHELVGRCGTTSLGREAKRFGALPK